MGVVRGARALVVMLPLLACGRSFSAPGQASGRLTGQPCDTSDQCEKHLCADGVCCESACAQAETCNAPGTAGFCTPRAVGDGCAAPGDCPTGFCFDHVCCKTDCSSGCHSCALTGSVGSCEVVPENTDPRVECGACSACFAGACGPAIPGTDPHGECHGGACSAQLVCEAPPGSDCDVDHPCALGECIAGRCETVNDQYVDGPPLLPTDLYRFPVTVGVSPTGDAIVLVQSINQVFSTDYTGTLVAVQGETAHGPWTKVALNYDVDGAQVGAVAYLGRQAFMAYGPASGTFATAAPLHVVALAPGGIPAGDELLNAGNDQYSGVGLEPLSDGGMWAMYVTGDRVLHQRFRTGPAAWTDAQSIGTGVRALVSGRVGGAARAFLIDGNGVLHALAPDGTDDVASNTPSGCTGNTSYLSEADRHVDGGGAALLVLECASTRLVTYDPGSAQHFTVTDPYAQGALDAGQLFYADGVLPVGGTERADTYVVSFAALGGADDVGTALLWVYPDGGQTLDTIIASDPFYGIRGIAAGSGPTAVPLMAYGEAWEGSGTGQPLLMLETFVP
ncbi:MAG: hypothetical protein JST54_29120 [Deltaproteobacteria bacterium]|nr:hypothetical protein [Deltaproteobacteria bacterium]